MADPEKFPNGVKDLSDKIHAMGLKVCPSVSFSPSDDFLIIYDNYYSSVSTAVQEPTLVAASLVRSTMKRSTRRRMRIGESTT